MSTCWSKRKKVRQVNFVEETDAKGEHYHGKWDQKEEGYVTIIVNGSKGEEEKKLQALQADKKSQMGSPCKKLSQSRL